MAMALPLVIQDGKCDKFTAQRYSGWVRLGQNIT